MGWLGVRHGWIGFLYSSRIRYFKFGLGAHCKRGHQSENDTTVDTNGYPGQEGDDLHDEGSESTLYTVSGEITIDEYKRIVAMFRTGQPYIHDPFEERDVKVIFAVMEYDSSNEAFHFELLEDVI